MSGVSSSDTPDSPSGEVVWGAFDLSSRRVARASSSGVAVATIKLVETVLSNFEADPSRTGGSPSEVARLIDRAREFGVDMGLFEIRLSKLVKPHAASGCEWELSRLETRIEGEPPYTTKYAASLIAEARRVGVDTSGYEERLRKLAPIYAASACERGLSLLDRTAVGPEEITPLIEAARLLGMDTSRYEEHLLGETPIYFASKCERVVADFENHAPESWLKEVHSPFRVRELFEAAREAGVDISEYEERLAEVVSRHTQYSLIYST